MYENVTALVLSSRRAGEADKRLALYTREAGRVSALAVGASRAGAKLGPATETAVEARFRLWRESGAPWARVTGGGVENAFAGLRARWERMAAAQFMCEWTERLTPSLEPHAEKYDLLRASLSALETQDPEAARLSFMVRFLLLAGYNPLRDIPSLAAFADGDLSRAPAPHHREQLLKFVAPLLSHPLRSAAHEESLRRYRLETVP